MTAPAPLPPARETALRGGAFNSAVRELLSYYISLEEYYMEESVAKVGLGLLSAGGSLDGPPERGSLEGLWRKAAAWGRSWLRLWQKGSADRGMQGDLLGWVHVLPFL